MLDSLLIQIRNLTKSYVGVCAVDGLTLEINSGEVHAICGENGAGKSTLIKALTGVVVPEQGQIQVAGESLPLGSVAASEAAGIAVMHQESTAFDDLDAVDNVFVGRELTTCRGLLLDRSEMKRQTLKLLDRLGETIEIDVRLSELPIAQRQMVAMARALSRDCRLLIMDEPTASLSARETAVLLRIIDQLRREGVTILYVTHRLEEIFQIADRVTVLRDGRLVATRQVAEVTTDALIRSMVGREVETLTHREPQSTSAVGNIVLEVAGLSAAGGFRDVSFTVRAGEIVGLAGLVGAGRSEVARAIFGIDRYDSGRVSIAGSLLPRGSVPAAIQAGVALVPEDRQHEGLVLPMSVAENISLAVLRTIRSFGFTSQRKEAVLVEEQMRALDVRAAGMHVPAEALSGGNQQKVVLGKWLASRPRLLILDEPTRGVDVGAKAQVHRLIRTLAGDGIATLVISSELPELLSISDRILVMCEGRLVGEFDGATATQEQILAVALPDAEQIAAP